MTDEELNKRVRFEPMYSQRTLQVAHVFVDERFAFCERTYARRIPAGTRRPLTPAQLAWVAGGDGPSIEYWLGCHFDHKHQAHTFLREHQLQEQDVHVEKECYGDGYFLRTGDLATAVKIWDLTKVP